MLSFSLEFSMDNQTREKFPVIFRVPNIALETLKQVFQSGNEKWTHTNPNPLENDLFIFFFFFGM